MPSATPADGKTVGHRLATIAAAVALAAVAAAAALGGSKAIPNWAAPQIKTVVSHKLMAKNVRTFKPNVALKQQSLADLASGLQQELASPDSSSGSGTTTGTTTTTTTSTTTTTPTTTAPPVTAPTDPVSMAQLDRQLVYSLGLQQASKEFA